MAPGGLLNSTAQSERGALTLRVFRAREEPRHQAAAEVVAGRRRSYGDAADRQRDRANKGLSRGASLSAFSARVRSPSSGGGGGSWPGAGAATGTLLIDSAIARTWVFPAPHYLVSVSRARARGPAAGGFDPGAPAWSYGVASPRADRNRWPRGAVACVCSGISGWRDRALYPWACGRRGARGE